MADRIIKSMGVVIVAFESADVIADCLESLLASDYEHLKIVVCDNASADETCDVIRALAHQHSLDLREIAELPLPGQQSPRLTLLHSGRNLGYAGAVNRGLACLESDENVDLYWVLNPDCVVGRSTASSLVHTAATSGPFSLMGSRLVHFGDDEIIQSDGGTVSLWTGICRNQHQGQRAAMTHPPDPAELQFISGANMVASREFYRRVGPMSEDYFLYYEEVDWALRRGNLPLIWCSGALVQHHGGTTIGTGAHNRSASGFANYFNYRNRMLFIKRFNRRARPIAYLYSALKVLKIRMTDSTEQATGAWRGLNMRSPDPATRDRISSEAHGLAFPQMKRLS